MLTIGKKQYEAKTNFKFEKLADKKYRNKDNELSGLESIYQDLLSFKASALVAFWDCATAHYKKEQPIVDDIEDALEQLIESDESEVDRLFKEAFKSLDESGFFKKQLNEFWKNLDIAEKMADDEKELKQIQTAKKMYKEKRKELLA